MAITSWESLRRRRRREAADRRIDPEVRIDGVTLGEEQVEGIGVPLGDQELRGRLVEIDRACLGPVHAAEIDGQLPVDERPEVVVARAGEDLAAVIGELGVELEG